MEEKLSRKEFLSDATKYAVGAAVAGAAITSFNTIAVAGESQTASWPWPYATLDIEAVRKAGHDAYFSGKGCSYGSFHALVEALRTAVGEPWLSLPSEIMIYGHGGGAGWGGLCGALNGSAALISLVCTKERSDVIISELFGWYTQSVFPSDTSNDYATSSAYGDNRLTESLPQNMSGSILCHVSVTEWCNHAEIAVGDLKRKERCARLTGDVAAHTAKMLNDELAGTFAAIYTAPESIAACGTCHGSTGDVKNTAVKMDCLQCHGNMHNTIATSVALGAAVPTFTLEQNYPNPFNPETTIEFSLPQQESVTLGIYDLNGRRVRTLFESETKSAGVHRVRWDGKDDQGARVASGIYFSRIVAGEYAATAKMSLMK